MQCITHIRLVSKIHKKLSPEKKEKQNQVSQGYKEATYRRLSDNANRAILTKIGFRRRNRLISKEKKE